MTTAAEMLDSLTVNGELYEKLPEKKVRCYACGHRCLIRPGGRGICKVRFNDGGTLRVPWGYVAGLQADPIEKKPFFHVLPGQDALTFGMLGCDFHCQFCQNWLSSQVLREPACDLSAHRIQKISPEQIVAYTRKMRASVIASSYNEPLITSEWSAAIFRLARLEGLKCVYVSNGNLTPEVLDYLKPYLCAIKIDLKTMQDKQYRSLGGVLKHVLDGIQTAHAMGLWVEVVTLVVPGFNDSNEELMETARFVVSVSPDIPWHVTAFHPDFQMTDRPPTSAATIVRAAEIGEECGLNFVYAGNLRGQAAMYENTRCPKCHREVIKRVGYSIQSYKITAQGTCPFCGSLIPGIWHASTQDTPLGGLGLPRRVG